jgi:hypothetical protein
MLQGHLFFRSYEANLQSSLTRVISRALVYSTHLPVSVLVRTPMTLTRGYFLSVWTQSLRPKARIHFSGLNEKADLPTSSPYRLKPQSNKWLTYPTASPHR